MTDELPEECVRQVVYLAGPDVFLPDAADLGERKKAICRAHGFDAYFPLDSTPGGSGNGGGEQVGQKAGLVIFDACVKMMRECHLAIANLTPFRGISMDVGTAVELGFMHALGKPVFGYTNVPDDYHARVAAAGVGDDGHLVERFGFFDNLMCEGPIRRSGGEVVRLHVPAADVQNDLNGFEKCVRQARRVLGAARAGIPPVGS
jgi:nucleoside 2-deoxyribosyltransferase